jgi:O-antigen/teichoic acid export membrane protein
MFAQQRVAAAVRYAHLSAVGFAVATLLYLIALWFCWPVLAAHVLPPAYHGLQAVVPLWGIATLFGLLRSIYSLEAQCVPIFREAFYASAVAMVTVFAGLVLAVVFGTATTTVLAVAAGETAALVVLLLILRRRFGRPTDLPIPATAP